ncbi:MAG: response regulator transcription factor [bacterium]|nr:response regulator transcription factor [bacterium]
MIKILLADDHKIMRDGMTLLMQREGDLEVVAEADDGEEAVRLAYQTRPDVVLMDINMPGMDGIEATRKILAELPEARVIALTSHTEGKMVQEMFRAGALAFLGKNCSNQEILDAVRSVMTEKYYISEEMTGKVIEDFVLQHIPQITEVSDKLTNREKEVLRMIAEGFSTKKIAETLNLSSKTVGAHRENLMKKLDLHNVAQLTRYAIQKGLISLHP